MSTTVSPLTAAFLAADRIGKPGGAMNSIHAPVKDVRINFSDLCARMLAYTLVCLADDGAIEMSSTDRKSLFGTKKQVTIQKKRESTQVPGADALLAAARDGKTAHDAVYAWLGADSLSPWQRVVKSAFKEASDAGLLAAESGGGVGAMVTGLPKIRPVSDKQAQIDAIVSACAERWKRFESESADFAQQLVKECYAGINGRVDKTSMTN
jgi:hypothetical protein